MDDFNTIKDKLANLSFSPGNSRGYLDPYHRFRAYLSDAPPVINVEWARNGVGLSKYTQRK